MTANLRRFEVASEDAPRGPSKLLIGLVGASASGKTYSALRLAAGVQRVTGSKIVLADTEGRGEDYKSYFKYSAVRFPPPYSGMDYVAAMEQAMAVGGPDTILIVDSCSHEHSGEGGRMWQSRTYIEEHIARERQKDPRRFDEDWKVELRAKQLFQASLIKPSAERSIMNEFIRQRVRLGIFCFRAKDVVKQVKRRADSGKETTEVVDFGWQHDTTSALMYEMKVQFMLPPFSEGVPDLSPTKPGEQAYVKRPRQFRGDEWLEPGKPITEDLGEKLARWAAGDAASAPIAGRAVPPSGSVADRALKAVKDRFPGLAKSDSRRRALAEHWNVDTPEALRELSDDRVAIGQRAFDSRIPLDEYLDELDAQRQLELETIDAGREPGEE